MKKVYQTIIDKHHGNCLQANVASFLEMPLLEVPNYIEMPVSEWFPDLVRLLDSKGYVYFGELHNLLRYKLQGKYFDKHLDFYNNFKHKHLNQLSRLKDYIESTPYFMATVYSPRFCGLKEENPLTHAVIIDGSFNIVHDPNPDYRDLKKYPYADELGYNGVLSVSLFLPYGGHTCSEQNG